MLKTSKSLIDLIDIAARRHANASGRRLAELAQQAGHDISHATLNRLRQGTYASRPSDASIRAIAFLADVSENTAFLAAGVTAPRAVAYQPPRETQRMNARQRKALDELIRAFVTDEAPNTKTSGMDYGRLLAARERLNVALTTAGDGVDGPLGEAAREAIACIDTVTDALFAAADDSHKDGQSCSPGTDFEEVNGSAHALG